MDGSSPVPQAPIQVAVRQIPVRHPVSQVPDPRAAQRPGAPVPDSRFEALLRDAASGPAGPRLADAADAARRRVPAADEDAAVLRDVGAGLAAPILVAYVFWLLLEARARGLKRLYFLSRDGQVLKEIADILAPRLGIAIERRYLLASRQAWNRARGAAQFDSWLWNDAAAASPGDILRRLAVPPEAVAAELAGIGLPELEAPLDAGGAARMRAWTAGPGFAAAARAAAAESRALLADYLAQEGVFDPVPMAVVDLGWTGSQHETLCDLLVARGRPPCPCYLFGAKARAARWSDLRHGFYFDEGRAGPTPQQAPQHALAPRDLYVLMEMFCTAPEGTLTGFFRADGRVLPDCAPDRGEELAAWGLPVLRASLHAAAESLEPAGLAPRHLLALRSTIGRLLEAFWLTPTPEEARVWGRFPWDAGQGHEPDVHPLADPYALADMPAVAWAPQGLRKREIFWVEGALAMTPAAVAPVLRGTRGLRTSLGAVLRRLTRRRAAS